MKKVIVLGSTGSLGKQTLQVLRKHSDKFRLIGISANTNEKLLKKQAKSFKIPSKNTVLVSKTPAKFKQLASQKDTDIIINNISGIAGIPASKAALKSKKILLLSNKESLVAEGKSLMKLVKSPAKIIPVDSEHNAIHEIIKKYPEKKIKNVILPCSGGSLLHKKSLENVALKDVLAHPKWKMGAKITVESALLINKGLEIIEAHYLFNLPLAKIKVFLNPRCHIHGMVDFTDGTRYAYYAKPDMREHIENALLETVGTTPSRTIRRIPARPFPPLPSHLPGIAIVTNYFKKHPTKMKQFLGREEKTIEAFLGGRIEIGEVYENIIL